LRSSEDVDFKQASFINFAADGGWRVGCEIGKHVIVIKAVGHRNHAIMKKFQSAHTDQQVIVVEVKVQQ
jgi:hypothetical protein